MPRPDEGLIHTWLDGECTPEEAARIEHLVATDPEWAAAVAEARGLIAASSRIVSVLDTVPAAMPRGAQAAPRRSARRGFRVPAWMGMAAALVLVAGTAYVLREQANEPFAPTVATEASAPAASDAADPPARPADSTPQPTTVQNAQPAVPDFAERGGSAATADATPASAGRGAGAASPPPPPPGAATEPRAELAASAERTITEEQLSARRQLELAKAAAESASAERELRLRRSALRQEVVPTAAAPLADAAIVLLEGCWRVSAPPEQVGLLQTPQILVQRGDSLLLRTPRDSVWVLRTVDRLRGGLEARREACPPPSP